MEGRIIHLSKLIENATIVAADAAAGEVRAGCVVSLKYEGDDDVEKFLIGSIEERREGVIVMSPGSPMGQALIGAKPGEAVSYESPGGIMTVEIVAIEA